MCGYSVKSISSAVICKFAADDDDDDDDDNPVVDLSTVTNVSFGTASQPG